MVGWACKSDQLFTNNPIALRHENVVGPTGPWTLASNFKPVGQQELHAIIHVMVECLAVRVGRDDHRNSGSAQFPPFFQHPLGRHLMPKPSSAADARPVKAPMGAEKPEGMPLEG
jgi:hypothetical protein